jgi:hypothetical protein
MAMAMAGGVGVLWREVCRGGGGDGKGVGLRFEEDHEAAVGGCEGNGDAASAAC